MVLESSVNEDFCIDYFEMNFGIHGTGRLSIDTWYFWVTLDNTFFSKRGWKISVNQTKNNLI